LRNGAIPGFCLVLAVSSAFAAPPLGELGSSPVAVPIALTNGHPSIELKIDGRGPYRLLFDTGSGAELILDQDLAEELSLQTTGTRRIGDPNAPGALEAKVVNIDRVELGGLTIRGVNAISWVPQASGVADHPRGVVGLGLFGPRLVTLDYGREELILEAGELPKPDGKAVLPASFADGIPSIPIDVAGVPFRAHIDSGSTGFLGLPLDAAKKLPLDGPPVVVGRARTASGDYAVSEAKLKGAVRLGQIVIDSPKVRFVDLPIANIGFDLLRSLIVTVDVGNGRVRLVSSGRPLTPSERPKLGIVIFGPKDGRLPIEKVDPGSPAAAAGLRAGDQIVQLNGRGAAAMSPFELSQALQARPLAITLLRGGETVGITVPKTPTP
jgi:predicted aspartyl protease